MSLSRALILSLGVLAVSACRTDLVRVQPLATSVQAPGQVAVYVAVADGEKPVTELRADDFTVYEDGEKLDSAQIKLSMLDADPYVEHQTLLLVDTSGSAPDTLAAGVAAFVRKARDKQAVSVYSFDGSDRIHKVADFPREVASKEPQKVDLGGKKGDTSRNLNGAVIRALDEIDEALAKSTKPVRVGTLVVVTRGADFAGRVSEEQVRARLEQSRTYVYAVGVGGDFRLEQIGRTGTAQATSDATAQSTLEEVAATTNALEGSHYLLAYCSPARAGQRLLRVEVTRKQDENRVRTGGAELRFDASGFEAQCDPKQPPRFVVSLLYDDDGPIAASAPEIPEGEEEEAKKEEEAEKKPPVRRPAAARPVAPSSAPASKAPPKEPPAAPPAEKPAEKPGDGFEP